jgi:uncharacterized protein (TIGR02453 family)
VITKALFEFLRELADNNERPWFQANKARYERDVRDAMVDFMEDLEPHLHKISKNLVVDPRPQGGSMMRIFRDTRFSRDKSPYKTNVGVHFSLAAAKDIHAPGFYLNIQPDQSYAAAGCWHPDPTTLGKIRQGIVEQPKAWKKVHEAGIKLEGDALKRVPSGFAADHPYAEDLKRKDFVTSIPLTEKEITSKNFPELYAKKCAEMAPLMKYLARALEVPF